MQIIVDFSKQTSTKEWRIVNDGVMGGVSKSNFSLTEDGFGRFYGHVSLANNGGFAAVQLDRKVLLDNHKFIVLRIKGDGKRYEFRLKSEGYQRESYVHSFTTNGDWQNIKLQISEFYPQFRGTILNIPNFNFDKIAQISFLIANKVEEDFELTISSIKLE